MILAFLASAFIAEWNPPARYDHEYTGEMTVKLLPPARVPGACRRLFRASDFDIEVTRQQRGCAVRYGKKNACTIIAIDRPAYGTTPEAVIRHERGHCNGWHHSHPD